MATLYFTLSLLGAFGALCAIIQARRLYWAVPIYFFAALGVGEFALLHLFMQLVFTALLAFGGVFEDPLAQAGLGIYALSWIGLLYLHNQAMDSQEYLGMALRRALGEDYRFQIPEERRAVLRDYIVSREWMRPVRFHRDGVKVHSHISYGAAR